VKLACEVALLLWETLLLLLLLLMLNEAFVESYALEKLRVCYCYPAPEGTALYREGKAET